MGALPEMKTIRDLSGFEKQLNRGYRRDMVALFVLLALGGLVVMVFAHRHGPWVDASGVEQIAAARNFAWGNGLTVPTAGGNDLPYGVQPPLYSLLLSLVFWLNLDPFIMVSAFNVVLFAATLLLLSWGLWKVTDSLLMALGITLLFSVSPNLIRNFDSATSYGLLISLVVANLVCLSIYFQQENRRPYLLAILTAALAFFTDFAGAATIMAGFIVILIFSEKAFWRRVLFAGIYAFGAALPLIVWQVVQLFQPVQPEMRAMAISMTFRDALSTYLTRVVNTFVQWLPGEPGWLGTWLQTRGAFFTIGVLSLGLFGLFIWRYITHKDAAHRRWMILLSICLLFIVSAILLIFTETYVQSRTAPELMTAMLAPLYPFLIIFVFGCMLALVASFNLPLYALALPIILGGFFIVANLAPSIRYVHSRYAHGSSYTTPQWQNSDLIYTVRSISALRTYFSNDPAGVLLYTVYAPYDISGFDYEKPFLEQDEYLVEQFNDWMGTLLLFQPVYLNPHSEDADPIDFSTFTEGLQLVYRGADGEMYVPIYSEESEN